MINVFMERRGKPWALLRKHQRQDGQNDILASGHMIHTGRMLPRLAMETSTTKRTLLSKATAAPQPLQISVIILGISVSHHNLRVLVGFPFRCIQKFCSAVNLAVGALRSGSFHKGPISAENRGNIGSKALALCSSNHFELPESLFVGAPILGSSTGSFARTA